MSDFMERNVSNFFKHLDIKKNGYISLKDFLELPEHLADAEEVVGADREQLIASFAELWRKYMKSAGSDDEGLLTASILVESIRQQKNDPVFKEAYLAVCRYVYFSLDINRDGFLQEDEYARAFSGVGLHDTEISRRVFEAIDLNKDGKLSFEEYASALYGNLVSEDENGPYALVWTLLE